MPPIAGKTFKKQKPGRPISADLNGPIAEAERQSGARSGPAWPRSRSGGFTRPARCGGGPSRRG